MDSPPQPALEVDHAHGIHSSVVRVRLPSAGDSDPKWKAIKRVGDHPPWKFQPHSVRNEIRILLSLRHHPNVIEILEWRAEEKFEITWEIHMPLVPLCLSAVLDSVVAGGGVKSIARQVLRALAHIHSKGIAHRDVKPSNVLIDEQGVVKLVDFGVAWARIRMEVEVEVEGAEEEYQEDEERMCCAVATGPYRAPELLFSPRKYDPYATDLWSFGAMLAEFFTSLKLYDEEDDDDETPMDDTLLSQPFIGDRTSPQLGTWKRLPLFDATRGEIGLAWSIFRVRGTPDEVNWPSFKSLPDAESATFRSTPRIDVSTRLPHLSPTDKESVVALLEALLEYEPARRIRAENALECAWLSGEDGEGVRELKEMARREVERMVREDERPAMRGGGGGGGMFSWNLDSDDDDD